MLSSSFFFKASPKFENGSDLPESEAPYFFRASALSMDSKSFMESVIFLFDKSFSAIQTSRVSPPVHLSGLASAGFSLIADFFIIKSKLQPIGRTVRPFFLSEAMTVQEILSLTFLSLKKDIGSSLTASLTPPLIFCSSILTSRIFILVSFPTLYLPNSSSPLPVHTRLFE